MQPRTSALGLLNAIQPLTQSDNTIETARAELALFFSTLNTTHPSPLTPEKKTKLHENVSTLRTYLLTQLLDIEKTKTENPSYTNIYNTLILLAQCFPLNKKNEHNQILMTSSNEAVKIPIDNKNRFIAANGYWYRVPNIDYEKTFEENQIDAYLPEKKWAHASNISQQDINRTTLLTSQWPKTSYKSQDDVTLSMMIGTGMGLMTVVILLLVIIVSSGGVALAGIGIGILGLIVGGIIQGANIGMAVNTTAGLIRDYFKNKKINHIDVSDFSHEENKINSLLYMSNTETKLPIASKAEAQKPYFSFAFKRSLINRGSIGMVIGAVIGIVATAAILVFAGPAALPAIALFAILFGPSIGLPFVFGIERVVSHSVSFVKEKFTKPSVVETNDAPQQPSQTKTVTPDLSNTHLKTLEQLSPTNTVYPVIKKNKTRYC